MAPNLLGANGRHATALPVRVNTMFLIPLLILAGGAVWFAVAKATNTTATPATSAATIMAQQQAADFITQARGIGLSTAQIQDAWAQNLSPQAYYAAYVAPAPAAPDSTASGWGQWG